MLLCNFFNGNSIDFQTVCYLRKYYQKKKLKLCQCLNSIPGNHTRTVRSCPEHNLNTSTKCYPLIKYKTTNFVPPKRIGSMWKNAAFIFCRAAFESLRIYFHNIFISVYQYFISPYRGLIGGWVVATSKNVSILGDSSRGALPLSECFSFFLHWFVAGGRQLHFPIPGKKEPRDEMKTTKLTGPKPQISPRQQQPPADSGESTADGIYRNENCYLMINN